MTIALRAGLRTLAILFLASAALAEPYPFPAIENVPDRKLIGVDQNGHPHIAEKDKSLVAKIAASSDSPENLRSYAIWGLAISGYSPEAVVGLTHAVLDKSLSSTARGYAAMGLGNFTRELPPDLKSEIRANLRSVVKSERAKAPDGPIRTLLVWDDAEWIAQELGDDLTGHEMEIEILAQLPAARSIPRLLEIYRTTPRNGSGETYNRRAAVGRALTYYADKRGIDILDTLLEATSVPTLGDGTPNHQFRHNVFREIQKAVGRMFGYEHLNYHPSIDDAISLFRAWWLQDRYDFQLPKQ